METLTSNAFSAITNFDQWQTTQLAAIEARLDELLTIDALSFDGQSPPSILVDVMRYAVLGGGKRLRPLLVLASFEAFAPSNASDAIKKIALDCACAVEVIHAYSLIHDDLPCMDNDVLRRGKPTVHVKYGEALALLAGDTLQALAFQWLTHLEETGDTAQTGSQILQAKLCALLSRAIGPAGMAGGQTIDLINAGNKNLSAIELQKMHQCKTGALLKICIQMGAACVVKDAQGALNCYGAAIGLAFQVVDDILDTTTDTTTLGKSAGKDSQDKKPTYITLWGLVRSQAIVDSLYQQAIEALNELDQAENPPNTVNLRALAQLIVRRSY